MRCSGCIKITFYKAFVRPEIKVRAFKNSGGIIVHKNRDNCDYK